MYLQRLFLAALASAALITPSFVVAEKSPIRFGDRARTEFAPANGETLAIPFDVQSAGEVELVVYTGDGDRIWSKGPKRLDAGRHEWQWDGRDHADRVVPDEAYHPVLVWEGESGKVTRDPRATSGGRRLGDLNVQLQSDGRIAYQLSEPARSLVRVGIDPGAMVEALTTWSPHSAGSVVQRWDGLGVVGEQSLRGHPKIAALVRAFSLPEQTIITAGNREQNYLAYRQQLSDERREANYVTADEGAIGYQPVREATRPVSTLRPLDVSLEIVDGADGKHNGMPVIDGPATFRVRMSERDRQLMQGRQYEVAFLHNYEFVSEEESGYTPIVWRWAGNEAEPGVNTMVVNIIGMQGRVGVAGVRFWSPAKEADTE